MHMICQNGFEHHAAMNRSHCAAAVAEGLGRYLGWQTLPPQPAGWAATVAVSAGQNHGTCVNVEEMNRRAFCLSASVVAVSTRARGLAELVPSASANAPLITAAEIERIDRDRILRAANEYLSQAPITITATSSPRSKGGKHDYFSEGDYWWPDPKNPNGPYIRRDGFSDPQNFNDHREALIRLSLIVPALTAAWLITEEKRYAEHAALHLRAWFVDPATRMNPSLEYAQAIWGITPGRGTGIIDTLHLVEVAQAARHIEKAQVMTAADFAAVRDVVHGVPALDALFKERAGRGGCEEQSRHLLGSAGGGVCSIHRK